MHKGLSTARCYIGTSGWSYTHWKQDFYQGRPQKEWLRYCMQHFTGIEINSSHYHLLDAEVLDGWQQQAPADFRFSLKANRYLTHLKRLKDPQQPIVIEKQHARALADKLAVVLWQLPGNFKINFDRLTSFCAALAQWQQTRHCIEFRHPSWFTDEVADCLHKHGIAACQSDSADWPLWDIVTTDLVYIRLHGHTRTYQSAYNRVSLSKWQTKLQQWLTQGHEVHVYFDNDANAAAPRNALQLLDLLHHASR